MKITLTEKRFFEWHEDDISVTLRNKSGSYGGSEVLVICKRCRFVQSDSDGRDGNDHTSRKSRPQSSSVCYNGEKI